MYLPSAAILLSVPMAVGATFQAVAAPDIGPSHASASATFAPDTVLTPPGGPRVVLLGNGSDPIAALRLHVPLDEGPAEAGAGRLLLDIGVRRAQGLARPVGARVSGSRTPWGLSYTVEGAVADLEYLGYLLRQAVAAPVGDAADIEGARGRLLTDIDRRVESPPERLIAALRSAVVGGPPEAGSRESLRYLDAAGLREVWRRSHQASAMTLVAVAPVEPEVVLAALGRLGAPEEAAAGPLDARVSPASAAPASPPPLRVWVGRAWRGEGPNDPRAAVVALLVARYLDGARGDFEARVGLVELAGGPLLTLTGSATGRAARALRRVLDDSLASVRTSLDATAVARAARAARFEWLLAARTSGGLAERVGYAMEARGDPAAAVAYLEGFGAVGVSEVATYLDAMLARGAVPAEITP